MLNSIDIEKILFLDIETVPQYPDFESMPEKMQVLWEKKAERLKKEGQTAADVYEKAGIFAEFGKIVCISIGYVRKSKGDTALFVKVIASHDEKEILLSINKILSDHFNTENHYLCAHNGKEFDFPYIARRSLINGIKVAGILDTPGAKPWEVRHLDTLELWKFGDYKHWTSLDLLTTIFDIPSPKTDMDGSMVADVYWKDGDLQKIADYCRQDVIAVVQLFRRYRMEPLIDENFIFVK